MLSFIATAFNEGGFFMYVILAFGLFTFTYIAERYIALYVKFKAAPANFRDKVMNSFAKADFTEAERFAVQSQSHLGNVVAVGCHIRAQGGADEEIQARMDEQLTSEIEKIDQRTGFLAMFGNVATLVGLLGTIVGMIHSFSAVASANPIDRATLLSRGIAEAMNCTAFGLIVAVPALVAYAIYQSKTDKIINSLTASTTEIYHDLIFMFDGASVNTQKTQANAKSQSQASLSH